MSIIETISLYLQKDYEEQQRSYLMGLYHVSDLCNQCLRQTWYKYTVPSTFDMVKAGIFMRGDVYEAWLAAEVLPKIFPDKKILRQIEMADQYKRDNITLTIQGHADILFDDKILEVKTIGSKSLDWLTEPKIENVRQLNYYCWKQQKDGLLVYLSPDTLARKEFEIKPDEGEAQKLIADAFTIDSALRANKPCNYCIHWACNRDNRQLKLFCDFAKNCVKDNNEELPKVWEEERQRRQHW